MVTLPSSFAGGMQGALESIQRGQLPQSVLSPVKTPSQVKQTTKKKTYEVEFENGTTVEFDRQPTMQDIDEAWSQVQNYKAPAPESPIGSSFFPQSTTQAINRLKEAPKVYKDVVGGAISSIPSQLGNIAKFGTDVGNALLPGQPLAGIGQRAQQLGQQGQGKVQEFYGARPETPYTKVGEFAGELTGGTLLGGAVTKGASTIPKIQQIASKLPLTYKIAKGATEGLAFDVASQGEAGIGTVVGGALPIAGVGLSKGVEYFTKKLPTSLQLQGLMNPAKVTLLKKQLQTEGTTAPDDVAKWMIDRNIKGTKEDIIQNLITRAEQSKQAVDDSLASIQKTFSSPTAKQALQQSYDDLAKVVGLEDEAQTALTLLGKDQYTLSELNQIKRILDRQYNLYTKTGDPTAGLKAQGLQKIRSNLRSTIENEAEKLGIKNIRALNNETQVARTMADAIARKDSADAVREALTAFAPSGIGAVIGGFSGPFDRGTLAGNVGNILFGMLAGRVVGSTKLKTNVASFLSKLSKKEVSALDAYLKAGGKSALPLQILEKLDDTIKLLPPASGLPTSAKVVDVKPMTGFSPGVMQKQSEAISSKVGTQPGTKSILQSLSKSPVNSEKGILPKPQQKKVNIPGKKVNNPIIQKLAKKQETPKTLEQYNKSLQAKDIAKNKASNAGKTITIQNNKTGAIKTYEYDKDPAGYDMAELSVEGGLAKKVTPKTPEDWTKKDFTKATETKSVDKFGNTVVREQGKTSAIDSITVGGKKYTNLDIPDSSRELYELDGKVYEYKNGKMIPEGAKTPQVEGKTVEKIKAMQLEQEDMIRKGESISEDFRNKWNDLQSQYKKEFIDSRIASERKKVDSAIRDIETKIKENPNRAEWGKKQIQMEKDGFEQLKKGNYFDKKYQEHILKMREDAKKQSLLKGVKERKSETPNSKRALPMSQKSDVGKTDDYFYHGTSQGAFEQIQKEGIKPQRRGVSSLSKTEEYSRNWAFPEATGTKGVMLRVKKDFMEGKLFNTTKQRPKSDEMYELLTKETIPPEALEVLKDGKWQPLVKPKPSLPPKKSTK